MTLTTTAAPNLATLGQRIYYARCHERFRSLTEFGAAVAKRMGREKSFGESCVSQWQTNRTMPDLPTLLAIAQEGNVREEWLLLNRGNPHA